MSIMGRQPIRWGIGIDVGGSSIKSGLVGEDGTVEAFAQHRLERVDEAGLLLNAISGEATRARQQAEALGFEVAGVGVCAPGSLETATGIIHKAPNLPGLDRLPLRDRLTEALAGPIHLANDVNAAALGESCFGAGQGHRHFAMVALGTGIGGGLILDGRLYTGAAGFAAEIGHIVVDPDGPACPCGNVGCLERYAGAAGIVETARRLLADGDIESPLAALPEDRLTPEHISEAAAAGDALSRQVLAETGRWLGIAFITLINLLDPECIVLGGGVAQAGAPLFDAIRSTLEGRTMSSTARSVPVVAARLGTQAGMVGAGALALWPERG